MKRLNRLSVVFCVVMGLCLLSGCAEEESRFQTTFPLDDETITAALKEAGLTGVISDSETYSTMKGNMMHTIRDPERTYVSGGISVVVAVVSSNELENGRVLFANFGQKEVESREIDLEDWKQQLVFAALLYGGFEDEEALYQAFLEKDLQLPAEKDSCGWEAELPEGYCRLTYFYHSYKNYDENHFEVRHRMGSLGVSIYESYEVYQEIYSEAEE